MAEGAAPGFWERVKAEEREEKATERGTTSLGVQGAGPLAFTSLLSDVPVGLPGLTRAIKLQDKAARAGFDWPDIKPVFAKMTEEIAELEEAVATNDAGEIEAEFGDLLFVMANLARHLKIDPEAALRNTNQKFTRRFNHIESALAATSRSTSRGFAIPAATSTRPSRSAV